MADLAARLASPVTEYDEKWSALDFAGVADLWERDSPRPIYIGDEYAMSADALGEGASPGKTPRKRTPAPAGSRGC